MKLTSLSVLLTVLSAACGYRILVVFPVPSKSHTHLGKGIVGALLKAGHEVTFATPYPDSKIEKGLTYIEIPETITLARSEGVGVDPQSACWDYGKIHEYGQNISILAATNPGVRAALVKDKFDAVVTEKFFCDLQAGFAAVQQVPWILVSGTVMNTAVEAQIDDVRSAPLLPSMMNDCPTPMNLWQRLFNTFMTGKIIGKIWNDMAPNEVHYTEIFGPLAKERGVVLPPFSEAMYNISILFVNSHPSIAPAQSLPPNVIDIAGYHIDEHHSELPKDLQDLLDKSTQGVVYFSMGSVVMATGLSEHTKKDLIRIFGELPYTVLWKLEESLKGLPKNVHVRPWMPQPAILAHRNTRLFISHGGLLSTLEGIQQGVPLLAVPVFGDQPSNARRAVRSGYAVTVPFSPDMGEKLKEALKEILGNDSYYKRAKFLSRVFNKRLVPASKTISHYVELAIETKGAYHLRSPAYLYRWYERYMLDQLAVVLLTLYVVIKLLKFGVKRALKSITGQKQKKQ